MRRALPVLFLLACEDETARPIQVVPTPRPDAQVDAAPADARVAADAVARDAAADAAADAVREHPRDAATADAGREDAAPRDDAAVREDGAARDMAPVPDMAPLPDMAPPDMAVPDMAPPPPDMAPPPVDQGLPPGVRPCTHGAGTTLFAVHWDGGERPDIDHWAAACEPGFNINGCGAFPRCRDAIANCNVAVVDGGQGLLLDGNDDLLFRFHVNGLQFQGATLYFQARGTRGQGNLEVWSPIYGGLQGPVAGDAYAWYAVDWSELLSPFDEPGLTAIRFRAVGGNVAVHAVELCIE